MSDNNSMVGSINKSETIREVLVFVFKLLLVYFLWRSFSLLIGPEAQPINERTIPWLSAAFEGFNDVLKTSLAEGSAWLISLFGYQPVLIGNNMVKIQGSSGVEIGNYCLALELMVLYITLVATYPAPLKLKVGVILGGLITIHLVNMLRVAVLNLMTVHLPQYVDFNHHFTFRILVFLFILVIYNRYIKKASDMVKG
jgi:exosortase/archaeosortase family protein